MAYKYKETYLTEKDSQVQALCPVLNCIYTRKWAPAYSADKSIALVPLQGHVMRLQEPHEYDEAYKKWTPETTLCFPAQFKRVVDDKKIDLYNTAIEHLRNSEKIIIATDFDNEGAALAMEVIQAAGVEDRVEYMLHMGSANEEALREALIKKTPIPYKEMSKAGFARGIMDWAEGISLTRALSLNLARNLVLNFGGVQTPIVNMVVERDLQFEAHSSIKYWYITGMANAKNKVFDISIYKKVLDEKKEEKKENNIEKEIIADDLIKRILENPKYLLSKIEEKIKKDNPQKLYTQTILQKDVSKKYNLDPEVTLELTQKFYITDKISTYPRTDIDVIHEKEYADVPKILTNLSEIMHTELINEILKEKILKRPTVFDSKKVTSHGAIVPTTSKFKTIYNSLKPIEKNVFNLIADRYIENFLPAYEYKNISGEIHLFEDYYCSFSENIPLSAGFKKLKNAKIDEEISNYERMLPDLKKGDEITITNLNKNQGETKPKPRFTMDTLLDAMSKVANLYPEEKLIKEMLGESGIGTSATRANILQKLFAGEEPWLKKQGKQIISTEKARKFIKIMPKEIVSPIKRAILQSKLNLIEKNELSMEDFLLEGKNLLIENIEQIKEYAKDPNNIIHGAGSKKEVLSLGTCPICKQGDIYENGKVYMCSNAKWKNEGTKESPIWKNEGCDYKIFLNSLERFGKDKISKLEVKKLLESGKLKVTLISKKGTTETSYEKFIEINEKYGVQVNFKEDAK